MTSVLTEEDGGAQRQEGQESLLGPDPSSPGTGSGTGPDPSGPGTGSGTGPDPSGPGTDPDPSGPGTDRSRPGEDDSSSHRFLHEHRPQFILMEPEAPAAWRRHHQSLGQFTRRDQVILQSLFVLTGLYSLCLSVHQDTHTVSSHTLTSPWWVSFQGSRAHSDWLNTAAALLHRPNVHVMKKRNL